MARVCSWGAHVGKPVGLTQKHVLFPLRLQERRSLWSRVLIGLGVGAAVGAGIGAAVNGNESGPSFVLSKGQERAIGAAVSGAIGAVGGSVIGYFAGHRRRSQTLIHEAKE